ncbi:MAG: DUF427 domain-containing protein [Flavobacteriaceae bacterium]
MKAVWNDTIIAQSDNTLVVENNHYFPPESINMEFLEKSETHTVCPWKGQASYYTLRVEGKENRDAAWYYPETSDLARQIKGYVAFWKGVEVVE